MLESRFDFSVLKDPSWWHWAATVPLLALHLTGYSWALPAAIGLCVVAVGYFLHRLKRVRPYPVQVRVAYLALLLCGMLPGMNWIYWIPLVGTTAMVLVGYCPLLRLLSICPWNRIGPLSWPLVWRAFVREPCAGGLVSWPVDSSVPVAACCSLGK
ncbi:hypothetical protein NG895_11210 [Aeoliella sp. ICT_H6.2]|uniref:Uncharacterized protein n=1 Tax=Aeoliella straminimaris TaxID=2954799 RepID=A0A9X2JHB7_9BACT|nr:hypothetical protein [Aeoliella straminimaris]MCO6044473.1 hypothetical protein [Aeoliella straminimaris]